VPAPEWKARLRRLDHAAIYVKIAGTYTPFAVLFAGAQAAAILTGIWGAALVGAAMKVLAPGRFEWLTLGLYLAMGWAVLVIGGPILEGLSTASVVLVCVGGALYTLGVGFHLWDSLPFQNAIWHALVLAASFVFYAAIVTELVRSAPAV
jgi:hemolysin III